MVLTSNGFYYSQESPAEALKRKRDAKKKAKRATSAETDNNVEEDINLDNYDEVMTKKEKSAGKGKKKNKSGLVREEVLDEDEKRRLQDLELMFAGEDGAGAGTDRLRYSKKEFEKAAKNKDTKKKNKKHRCFEIVKSTIHSSYIMTIV